MSEDVSENDAPQSRTPEEVPISKLKIFLRERKVLVSLIARAFNDQLEKLTGIGGAEFRITALRMAINRMDIKHLQTICTTGEVRLGKEVVLFPGVKEASRRLTEAFTALIDDPDERAKLTKKGKVQTPEDLRKSANKGTLKNIQHAMALNESLTEDVSTPETVLPVEEDGELKVVDPEDTVSMKTGKDRLHSDFETFSAIGKWQEIRRVKKELLNEAAVAELAFEDNENDTTRLAATDAIARYLNFIFLMKGYDAAKKEREKIHKSIAEKAKTVKERRRAKLKGFFATGIAVATGALVWISSAEALTMMVAGALEAVRLVLASPGTTLGLIVTLLLHRYFPTKKFTKEGRELAKYEKIARDRDDSFEKFEQENVRRIGTYEARKLRVKSQIKWIGIFISLSFAALGVNEAISQGISWLYNASWLQNAVQSVTGIVSGGLHELTQSISGFFGGAEAVSGATSPPSVEVASTASGVVPIAESPIDATQDVVEPALVPSGLPVEATSGDGLTQVMQHLAEQGVTPNWFPPGMDVHSPEAWALIAQQLGIEGNGPIIHTGDTFSFTADGTLMIDPIGGSPQIAITSNGVLGDFLQTRMKP